MTRPGYGRRMSNDPQTAPENDSTAPYDPDTDPDTDASMTAPEPGRPDGTSDAGTDDSADEIDPATQI